jgi:cytochrome d ubiquinol oxidase subunit I
LASALSVVVLGDESGYSASHTQKMKLAAIEACGKHEPAPAPSPHRLSRSGGARNPLCGRNSLWVMGLIGTRSLTKEIPGINDLVERRPRTRIRSGIIAYDALMTIREAAR